MILNSKHKFIFIHIPKCAGISVTQAITGLEGYERIKYYKHIEARFLKIAMDTDKFQKSHNRQILFDDYCVFAVVRNPWARLHSYYYYIKRAFYNRTAKFENNDKFVNDFTTWHKSMWKETDDLKFNDWVLNSNYIHYSEHGYNENPILTIQKPQMDFLVDVNGKIIVHNIFKLEDGLDKIEQFFINQGWPEIKIGNANVNPKEFSYIDEYNSEAKAHVAKYFEQDIDTFKYTFEE